VQVWDLVQRSGGQLRATSGVVIGYDMAAVLAMAVALGVPGAAVVELVPAVEAVMVRSSNKKRGEAGE
jgi:hypothetical protein